jgi:beta-glucosidase
MTEKFLWGAATSSYQIEGAIHEGNRGVSIWDTFSQTPGKVKNSDTGAVAIDHFHRLEEDVQILSELGVNSYRFSIAWPRLFPHSGGDVEPSGINFYNRLIDSLIAKGIEPIATLYHWDLPQYLEDLGGWANRSTATTFADYARVCAIEFGDRVTQWITLNEPWCVSFLGYYTGVHAPGIQDANAAIASAHHTALAHGYATRAIKQVRPEAQVGLTVNMTTLHTDSDLPEVVENFRLVDANQNRWWIDALVHGRYPANLVSEYGDILSQFILPDDHLILKTPPDFLGVNYYCDGFVGKARAHDVSIDIHSPYPIKRRANMELPSTMYVEKTDFDWPVTPDGLGMLLERIHRDWPEIPVLYVHENGAAYNDVPDAQGVVKDYRRVEYLTSHIESMKKAISLGVPVKGYFVWSLFDNFEWGEGYSKRFGLVFVDFATQHRIPKLSYYTYKNIIEIESKKLRE